MTYHSDKLKKIYNKLPEIKCKGLCVEACSIVKVSDIEKKEIARKYAIEPFLSEEQIVEKMMNSHPSSWKCGALKDGRCTVYEDRPLICRLFGLVKAMKCPYGCIPDNWVNDVDAKKLLDKAGYNKNEY